MIVCNICNVQNHSRIREKHQVQSVCVCEFRIVQCRRSLLECDDFCWMSGWNSSSRHPRRRKGPRTEREGRRMPGEERSEATFAGCCSSTLAFSEPLELSWDWPGSTDTMLGSRYLESHFLFRRLFEAIDRDNEAHRIVCAWIMEGHPLGFAPIQC
jgi:hypothetical protein